MITRAFLILAYGLLLPSVEAAPKQLPTHSDVSFGLHPHQLVDVYLPPEQDWPFPDLVWYGGLWKPAKHVPDVNRFFAKRIVVEVRTNLLNKPTRPVSWNILITRPKATITFGILSSKR
jgi:hypothetical protein